MQAIRMPPHSTRRPPNVEVDRKRATSQMQATSLGGWVAKADLGTQFKTAIAHSSSTFCEYSSSAQNAGQQRGAAFIIMDRHLCGTYLWCQHFTMLVSLAHFDTINRRQPCRNDKRMQSAEAKSLTAFNAARCSTTHSV